MQINAKGTIAGLPALRVRDFLHEWRDGFGVDAVATWFEVSATEATAIVERFTEEGLIEHRKTDRPEPRWQAARKGAQLANASATRPLKRKTAERLLDEFLERVRRVNRDHRYVYRVERAVLFGSMLTNAQRVGDVDVAVVLRPRHKDDRRRWRHHDQRIAVARENGRRFRSVADEEAWPAREVARALRGQSRGLSLVEADDLRIIDGPTRVVFDASYADRHED